MTREKHDSMIKVILALAESIDNKGKQVILNKTDLEKATKIKGRQTILNVIRSLKKQKLIYSKMKEWRRNRKAEHYGLTPNGKMYAQMVDFRSELKKRICERVGITEEEYEKKRSQRRNMRLQRNIIIMRTIQHVMQQVVRGDAPPNMHYRLDIRTTSAGIDGWVGGDISLQKRRIGDTMINLT